MTQVPGDGARWDQKGSVHSSSKRTTADLIDPNHSVQGLSILLVPRFPFKTLPKMFGNTDIGFDDDIKSAKDFLMRSRFCMQDSRAALLHDCHCEA